MSLCDARQPAQCRSRAVTLSATLLALLTAGPVALASEAPVANQPPIPATVTGKEARTGTQPFGVGAARTQQEALLTAPPALAGASWVAGSQGKAAESFSFTVDRPVTVYLLVHQNGGNAAIPRDWVKTKLKTTWGLGSTTKGRDAIYR